MIKFKKTPIGEIPKDWKVVSLKDVVDIQQGEHIGLRNLKNEGYPVYGANGIIGYFTRFHYIDPQVVIACRGSTSGIVNMTKEKAFISNNAMVLLPKNDKILKDFLYYIMSYEYITGKIKRIISGMGIPQIIKRDLEKYKIPLPPFPEQKKIAEILRTVDDAIEKTDLAIEQTERLKKGLMQRLLTKGIKHERFKKTELGEIPEEWRVVRIRETGNVITGKTPPTSEARYWNGKVPFITPADIGDTPYVYTTKRYVSKKGVEKVGSLLPRNTVLVVCIGSTIGKVGLTHKESITNQQINAIICKDNINPHYLYYTLVFHSKRLKSWSGTAAVPIIKKSLFEKFKIPLPPLEEQKQIAEILSTVDRKLELLRQRREKLERVKRGLMKDLLTGRRRVKC